MANIGERCKVGTRAPETGLYRHSACGKIETFNKHNVLAPCANRQCVNRSADWVLTQKLP
jgi:hypothetical protein